MSRKTQVLLLEDVRNVGRKGEIATVKAGHAWNFLLPTKKAEVLTKRAYRIQIRLKEERAKQAAEDKKEAEKLSLKLREEVLKKIVKVDVAGNMYGSVTAHDIAELLSNKGYEIEKRDVILPHAVKKLGTHKVEIKLKEGVLASVELEVAPDRVIKKPAKEAKEAPKEDEQESAEGEEKAPSEEKASAEEE